MFSTIILFKVRYLLLLPYANEANYRLHVRSVHILQAVICMQPRVIF